uniref:Uncharacterized protein n=1 Tax=Dicentrarchus labrax TaxID=13489 RepID=A0A8C4E5A2_DICLA
LLSLSITQLTSSGPETSLVLKCNMKNITDERKKKDTLQISDVYKRPLVSCDNTRLLPELVPFIHTLKKPGLTLLLTYSQFVCILGLNYTILFSSLYIALYSFIFLIYKELPFSRSPLSFSSVWI